MSGSCASGSSSRRRRTVHSAAPRREEEAADRLGQEVRAEPEPEAKMAEIDALQQEGSVDLLSGRHESPEKALERATRGRMRLRGSHTERGAAASTPTRSNGLWATRRRIAGTRVGRPPSRSRRPALAPAPMSRSARSRRSRITCQRMTGSPARSHSITAWPRSGALVTPGCDRWLRSRGTCRTSSASGDRPPRRPSGHGVSSSG